jgi:hypothetical protein
VEIRARVRGEADAVEHHLEFAVVALVGPLGVGDRVDLQLDADLGELLLGHVGDADVVGPAADEGELD